jgi:hypothetical protein
VGGVISAMPNHLQAVIYHPCLGGANSLITSPKIYKTSLVCHLSSLLTHQQEFLNGSKDMRRKWERNIYKTWKPSWLIRTQFTIQLSAVNIKGTI